jgi:hypothetical protein
MSNLSPNVRFRQDQLHDFLRAWDRLVGGKFEFERWLTSGHGKGDEFATATIEPSIPSAQLSSDGGQRPVESCNADQVMQHGALSHTSQASFGFRSVGVKCRQTAWLEWSVGGNQEVQVAAMTSQGAVRMQRSRPNSAARVASKRAIVPYPVPSTIRRPRSRTMRPRVIMNTVKVASDMNNAASLRNIDISKTGRHLGSSHRLAYWTRCRTETHGFVTSEHRPLTSTPTSGRTMT